MKTWEKIFLAPLFVFCILALLGAGKMLFDIVWEHGWTGFGLIAASFYMTLLFLYAMGKNGIDR